jgi:dodecin
MLGAVRTSDRTTSRWTWRGRVVHESARSATGSPATSPRHLRKGPTVTDRTYKLTEIVGTSPDGVDQAIRNGIAKASETLRNLDWFEVSDIRGYLEEGQLDHFQVVMKIGFRLED